MSDCEARACPKTVDKGPSLEESQAALFLRQAASAVALICVVGYAVIGILRVGYQYELEWMEGGTVDIALRVRAGKPIYVAPSIEYAPFVYPPLYYWATAAVMGLVGEGFLAGRLVSYFSTLGIIVLICDLARREGGTKRAGLFSAALYVASFEVTGLWFDVARVDNLALFFVVAGWYVLYRRRGMAAAALAGALFALAALTKQTCSIPAVCMAVGLSLWDRRRAVAFVVVFAVIFGGASLWLDARSGGWYSFYVISLPSSHELFGFAFHHFWRQDILWNYSVAFFCAAYFLAEKWGAWRGGTSFTPESKENMQCLVNGAASREMPRPLFYASVLAGALVSAWAGRVRSGGGTNALLPAAAALALLYGPSIDFVDRRARDCASRAVSLVWFAVLVQFFILVFDPRTYIFTMTDERVAENYIRLLGSYKGEVFAPWHGYLPRRAGKEPNGHWMALYDVLRSRGEKTRAARERLMMELDKALAARRFEAIIADADGYAEIEDLVMKRHAGAYKLRQGGPVCSPVAGPKCRVVYVLECAEMADEHPEGRGR